MHTEQLRAGELSLGDVVRVPDRAGWWQVGLIVSEPDDRLGLDLFELSEDVACTWHPARDEAVTRSLDLSQPW